MIPRPPSSSPSIQPVLRKASKTSKRDSLSNSLHDDLTTKTFEMSSSSLSGGSLHSCPDMWDEKCVVISRRPKIRKVMELHEYTPQEIMDCWWDADDLMEIRKQAQAEAKTLKQSTKEEQRGYEPILHKARKRACVEMARETVLFDQCLMNYALNAKVSLKEAQERARIDAAAVNHEELTVLMQALTVTPKAALVKTKKNRSKTDLFKEMGARVQRKVRTAVARGA